MTDEMIRAAALREAVAYQTSLVDTAVALMIEGALEEGEVKLGVEQIFAVADAFVEYIRDATYSTTEDVAAHPLLAG